MPELPDITIYVEALERRILDRPIASLRVRSPFLLRTYDPPSDAVHGKLVHEVRRVGKRIAIGLDDDLWILIHLMIAGRLHWKPIGAKLGNKGSLASFDFPNGCLVLTEAGSKHRASLSILRGKEAWREHDPRGLEVLDATLSDFASVLTRENHTIKRALCDPHAFSGIGNSYSDEILHRAGLSPLLLTKKLAPDQIEALYNAIRDVFTEWIDRLREQTGAGFPEGVTAFRPEMAVHGRFEKPCPICSAPIQRIRYADRETNYCPRCQTNGKILADRSLSRLLKDDWPDHIDEL